MVHAAQQQKWRRSPPKQAARVALFEPASTRIEGRRRRHQQPHPAAIKRRKDSRTYSVHEQRTAGQPLRGAGEPSCSARPCSSDPSSCQWAHLLSTKTQQYNTVPADAGAAMPRLYGLRRRQAALAPTRAALVLAMGLLLGAMLTMLLQTAGEVRFVNECAAESALRSGNCAMCIRLGPETPFQH